jgi:DNA invertase Pin-like site-specific DNA recombinase
MKYGYARVSSKKQTLDLQITALEEAGCDIVFTDIASGKDNKRDGLKQLLQSISEDDSVIIWSIDRLGRSLKNLNELMMIFNKKKIKVISLNNVIDTTTAHGKLTFNIFASVAQFERDIVIERTKAGLDAARVQGRKGGRPKGLSKEAEQKAVMVEKLYLERELTINEICMKVGISKATLYAYLRHRGVSV